MRESKLCLNSLLLTNISQLLYFILSLSLAFASGTPDIGFNYIHCSLFDNNDDKSHSLLFMGVDRRLLFSRAAGSKL